MEDILKGIQEQKIKSDTDIPYGGTDESRVSDELPT